MSGIRINGTPSQKSMERESKKRARAEERAKEKRPDKKRQQNRQQRQQQQQQQKYHFAKLSADGASCSTSVPLSPFQGDADISGNSTNPLSSDAAGRSRQMGVFEFPWQAERLVLDVEGWDFRDVFFSSLVDGCSARIGLPGDRLGRRGAPFTVRLEDWPWTQAGDEDDADGADCIWSCALRQPLIAAGGDCLAAIGVGTPATANAS